MCTERTDYKPSRRDELIALARYGKITPEEVEAIAAAKGLPPFEKRPELPAFDPMAEPRWSIVMAVAWIAWRDVALVRENGPEFRSESTCWVLREWNEPVEQGTAFARREGWFIERWPEATTIRLRYVERRMIAKGELPSSWQMSVDEAETALWRALPERHLIAEAMNSERQPIDVPQREWSYLKLFEDGKRDVLKYDPLDWREPFSDVKLKRDDLLRLWPAPKATAKSQQDCRRWLIQQMQVLPTNKPKSKEAFWTEARQKFTPLSKRQFLRAWDWAVAESGAHSWSKAGQISKSNRRTK
jgi:hypothetical protein